MNHLFRKAAATFSLRIASMFFAFLTSVVLARLIGSEGLGTYTYIVSWTYLLAIPGSLGFDGLLGREIAIYTTKSAWGHLHGLKKWSTFLPITVSTILAVVASLTVWYFSPEGDSQTTLAFWIAMFALPLLSLLQIRRGMMRGLHRIVRGLMPEMFLWPVIQLILVGFAYLWLRERFTALWSIAAFSLSILISLVISIVSSNRAFKLVVEWATPQYQRMKWVNKAFPFILLETSGMLSSRIDILMLGAIDGVIATGVYAPVNRGSQLIGFVLMAFKAPLSPNIAKLFANGKFYELQQLLWRTNRAILLISSVFTLAFLALGYHYLLIFGSEFTVGLSALRIRCLGQFAYNIFVGLSPVVLSMVGCARITAINSILALILNTILNAVLIPAYGINGAAIATTASQLCTGIVISWYAYQKIGTYTKEIS